MTLNISIKLILLMDINFKLELFIYTLFLYFIYITKKIEIFNSLKYLFINKNYKVITHITSHCQQWPPTDINIFNATGKKVLVVKMEDYTWTTVSCTSVLAAA